MLHRSFIFLILFIALYGGGIISLGVPRHFSFLSEMLVGLFLLFSICARSGKGLPVPHLWHIFFSFIFVAIVSIIINDYSATRSIFSLRLIFRYYFFYLAIIIMLPNDDLIKKINSYIIILLLLQLPVVAFKFAHHGISERTAGAYAVHDGSIATTLPICFIFFMAAFYLLYRPKMIYIFSGLVYLFFSVVGAKRAVFFLYPLQFMAIYYYFYVKGTAVHISKKIMALALTVPLILVLSTSILYFNKTLNPDQEVGGEIDLNYTLEYTKRYSYGVDGYGYSFGRIATTIRIMEILTEAGFKHIVLGLGPGATTPSSFDSKREREIFERKFDEFRISYGWTTMNRIALEYGLAGALIFFAMLVSLTRMCLKVYRKETEPYWRAFAAGSLWSSFSMIFFAFTYHWTAFFGDTMPILYFYVMSVVYIRYHHRPILKEKLLEVRVTENGRQPMTV